jgi:hypothetical protein
LSIICADFAMRFRHEAKTCDLSSGIKHVGYSKKGTLGGTFFQFFSRKFWDIHGNILSWYCKPTQIASLWVNGM